MNDQTHHIAPFQRPITNDRGEWRIYWRRLGYLWRTEPEIDSERQTYLKTRLTIVPNIKQGIYPFGNIRLSRADLEWLLIIHGNGYGPIDWSDKPQRERRGLDLRGADLSGIYLQGLPLAGLVGGLSQEESQLVAEEEYEKAAVHLENAVFNKTHLEGAILNYAHLEEAKVFFTFLEKAELISVHFRGAIINGSQLKNVNLSRGDMAMTSLDKAHLEGVNLSGVCLNEARLFETYLEKADLRDSKLIGAKLYKVHLEEANLSHATLQGTDVYSSYLEGVNLQQAHLEKVYIGLSHLEMADLSGAYLEEADIYMSHLEGSNFHEAHLEGASLHQNYLKDAGISVDNLDRLHKWNKSFPATLPPASFEGIFLDTTTHLKDVVFANSGYDLFSSYHVHQSNMVHTPIDSTQIKKWHDEYKRWRMSKLSQQITPYEVNQIEKTTLLRNLLAIPEIKNNVEILTFDAYIDALFWINEYFYIPYGQWIDWSHDPNAVKANERQLSREYLLNTFAKYGIDLSRRVTVIWANANVGIVLSLELLLEYLKNTLLAISDDIFVFDPQDNWCFQGHHEGEFSLGRSHRSKLE